MLETKLRFNGSYLLDQEGWQRLEASDSDLINTTIEGRFGDSINFDLSNNLQSSVLSGVYRLESNEDGEKNKYLRASLGKAVDNLAISSTFRLLDFDTDYYETHKTSENGYDVYGMSLFDIKSERFSIKINFGHYNGSSVLILSNNDLIKDYVFYNWNKTSFQSIELRILNNYIHLYIDGVFYYKNFISEFEGSLESETNISINFEDDFVIKNNFINESLIEIDSLNFDEFLPEVNTLYELGDSLDQNGNNEIIFTSSNEVDEEALIDGYDGYDGYVSKNIDQFIFSAEQDKYFLDIPGYDDSRLSIYKDGLGFINFSIYINNIVYKLSTNVKNFIKNEIHHLAASWKLNNFNGDEMHLFLDGKEAENLIKFGSMVEEIQGDKFSDIEKERLQNFSNRKIIYEDNLDVSTVAGLNEITFNSYTLTEKDIGRSVIFDDGVFNGEMYVIKSYIGNVAKVVDPINFNDFNFTVGVSGATARFAPITKSDYVVMTDIVNSKFSVKIDGNEVGILIFKVVNGEVEVIDQDSSNTIEARVNLTTRRLEFVKFDETNYVNSISEESEVILNSYGLVNENINFIADVPSSTIFTSDKLGGSEVSSIQTSLPKPIDLDLVQIKKIIVEKFIPQVTIVSNGSNYYRTSFSKTNSTLLSSEYINKVKVNGGRYVEIKFDSDNIFYDQSNGTIVNQNQITVHGLVGASVVSETFNINKNGVYKGSQLFESITEIDGLLNVVDMDYESCVIELSERDSIFDQNGTGDTAKLFDFSEGEFFIGLSSSLTYDAYELTPGKYKVAYSSLLRILNFNLGDKMFIGCDKNKENQAESVIEEFKVLGEIFGDSRPKYVGSRATRSLSEEYMSPYPLCPDKNSLSVIPFNSTLNRQLAKLRRKEFLDEENNIKYKLTESQIDDLAPIINNEAKFVSYLLNIGISLEDAKIAFIESTRADYGPIYNIAKYFPNEKYKYVPSSTGPNSNFEGSGVFKGGYFIEIDNEEVYLDPNECQIEFWLSPMIDTLNDQEERIYFETRDVSEVVVTSYNSNIILLPEKAKEIVDIKLLESSRGIDSKVYDDIGFDKVTGLLSQGTGVKKDFSYNYNLINGDRIIIDESLPLINTKVSVKYIPKSSSGDFLQIKKDKYSNLVFTIQTNNNKKVFKHKIRWQEDSWNKVNVSYNKDMKNVYFIINGINVTGNVNYNVNFKDILNKLYIGGYNNSAMCRISNFRISRKVSDVRRNINGNIIDLNYNNQLSLNNPLLKDDFTTFIIDFNDNLDINQNTASIFDPKNGIYNFDVKVDDGFKKLDYELENLIIDLINRLKPAHTNAVVKVNKDRC